jgi:hypothetical protein
MRTKRRRRQRDDDGKERSKRANIQVQVQVSVSLNARLQIIMIKMWRAESILNGIRPFELSQNGLTDFQTSTCNKKCGATKKASTCKQKLIHS